jgi:acetylornithine/succinyldiaminopimelate/putrescine aminotransferase
VLDRLTEPGFLSKVEKKAGRLRTGLNMLARRYDAVTHVRSLGLMIGVELKGPASAVVRGLRERGILATRAGEHVLRLLPPLVIKQKDIREFLGALEAVLASGAGGVGEVTVRGAGGAVA